MPTGGTFASWRRAQISRSLRLAVDGPAADITGADSAAGAVGREAGGVSVRSSRSGADFADFPAGCAGGGRVLAEAAMQCAEGEVWPRPHLARISPATPPCSTACTALKRGRRLLVANVGDSRAVLGRCADRRPPLCCVMLQRASPPLDPHSQPHPHAIHPAAHCERIAISCDLLHLLIAHTPRRHLPRLDPATGRLLARDLSEDHKPDCAKERCAEPGSTPSRIHPIPSACARHVHAMCTPSCPPCTCRSDPVCSDPV